MGETILGIARLTVAAILSAYRRRLLHEIASSITGKRSKSIAAHAAVHA